MAPTVGMEAGRMGSGDGTGGYLSGYRSAQSGYPSQHSPSMAPYTQPVQRQPGVPPGRLQMSVGPIMPNPPSYHVPTAPPMPGFGQIPRGPAMVVQPQPIMYGNAPTLGYQPTPPPQQTYYGQPRYDDPYTYGSQILGNPGAISASQIVPLLPMDQAQRGQPFGYQLPLHAV